MEGLKVPDELKSSSGEAAAPAPGDMQLPDKAATDTPAATEAPAESPKAETTPAAEPKLDAPAEAPAKLLKHPLTCGRTANL